jgi:hypothetical protein
MPTKKLTRTSFIEELLKGKGVMAICREYGYKSASQVYKWKKQFPEFAKEMEKIMSSPLHAERIRASQTSKKATEETWRDHYFNTYRTTKDRVAAADAAGKTVTYTMHACDPSHPDFDAPFAERNNEEMLREAYQVEDDLKRKAVVENSLGMQKWIIEYLPVVGDKYSRGYRNKLEVKEQTNVLMFTNEGIAAKAKLLNDMYGKTVIDVGN